MSVEGRAGGMQRSRLIENVCFWVISSHFEMVGRLIEGLYKQGPSIIWILVVSQIDEDCRLGGEGDGLIEGKYYKKCPIWSLHLAFPKQQHRGNILKLLNFITYSVDQEVRWTEYIYFLS